MRPPTPGAEVTLVSIDCANQVLALRALELSMGAGRFAEVCFFTDRPEAYRLEGCRMIGIPTIKSRWDYSRFVVKELGQHITSSHLLLVQWDGYAVDPTAWRNEFLDYDYIGAPWGFYRDSHRVGNGGFSLRSKKLLDALCDPSIKNLDPEDEVICRRYRPFLEEHYGIRFAPEEVAGKFSFETTYPPGPTFGFHGLFNMWLFLRKKELVEFVAALQPRTIAGAQFLRLGQNYAELGCKEEAKAVLCRRLEVVPTDAAARALLSGITGPAAKRNCTAVRRNDPCTCGSGKRYKHCCGAVEDGVNEQTGGPAVRIAAPTGSAPVGVCRNDPSYAEVLLHAAMGHHQAGRLNDAEALYGQVLRLNPANAVARQYLGVLAMQHGDAVRGEALIREAIAARPEVADFQNNLGLCLRQQGRLDEAIAAYRRALVLLPDYAVAHNNLGLDLQALNRVDEAISHFRRAIELRPDFAEGHWNLGLALLLRGEFGAGWPEYEWRLRCQPFVRDRLELPGVLPWRGETLAGKSLLVRREQGDGDTIQFLRYVPLLAELGARVVVEVSANLADLSRTVTGVSEVVLSTQPLPKVDYYVNLLSLPARVGTELTAVPAEIPYLRADAARVAAWRHHLSQGSGLRVGLAWAGSPSHANDRNRSLRLDLLAPLFALSGICWVSVQKGDAARQLAHVPVSMADAGPHLATYADTAALVEALDLLITVDTSVGHLAGALAQPAWVLLPFAPDWRWLLDRSDSPWYPTMRLFRQRAPGDWSTVVAAVVCELRAAAERCAEVGASPSQG